MYDNNFNITFKIMSDNHYCKSFGCFTLQSFSQFQWPCLWDCLVSVDSFGLINSYLTINVCQMFCLTP